MKYTTPDNSEFTTLKQAMQYSNDTEQTEIALNHLNKSEIIYQLHPMSERLEQEQTVREAKIKLNKI